jgi:hypothetical protein
MSVAVAETLFRRRLKEAVLIKLFEVPLFNLPHPLLVETRITA